MTDQTKTTPTYRLRSTSYGTYSIDVDHHDGRGFIREWEDTNRRDTEAVLAYLNWIANKGQP